jgi:hypothetical protein
MKFKNILQNCAVSHEDYANGYGDWNSPEPVSDQ